MVVGLAEDQVIGEGGDDASLSFWLKSVQTVHVLLDKSEDRALASEADIKRLRVLEPDLRKRFQENVE